MRKNEKEIKKYTKRSTALAAKMKKALEESRKHNRKVQRTDADGSYTLVTRVNTHLHSSIENEWMAIASQNDENAISISINPRKNEIETEQCELNNHTHLTTVMADHDHVDGSGSEDNEDFMFDIDLSVVEGEVQDDDSCWSYETDNNDGAVAENSKIFCNEVKFEAKFKVNLCTMTYGSSREY